MGELTAFLALQTQSDFLGNLGLLVEDGLGLIAEHENNGGRISIRQIRQLHDAMRCYLTTETGLLSVVAALALREEGSLASLCTRVSGRRTMPTAGHKGYDSASGDVMVGCNVVEAASKHTLYWDTRQSWWFLHCSFRQ
jgi:hypothetical protein